MMDDNNEKEVDFNKLSVEERVQHKNWKARVSGYEALAVLFEQQDDEKSPEFSKYANMVKKFPVDSNAAAQEKGLAAVLAFVENAAIASKIAADVISGIISKCLMSPKAKTKELANAIILMYVEIEKQDIVLEDVLKGFDNKSPKIVTSCVALLRVAFMSFGPKVIKVSPIIKTIPRLLEDRDKNVRDEGKQLVVEVYKWMKDTIKPQLQGLKPVQLAELEAEFDKFKNEKPQPLRLIRSEQLKAAVPTAIGSEDVNDASVPVEVPEDIDPYELIEPVEILSKLPKDFYELCEAKKWQERKQALESLQQLLTPNPKLVPGDYGEIVKILRKFISKDANVVVIALAGKCLADLASRLRKGFHPYAHACVVVILEKFKEKKQNVVSALREAIDALMLCTNLETILEDITTALDNKNPQIKSETSQFLSRYFSTCSYTILGNKKILKPLTASLIKTLNDMDATVRDSSAEAIGTWMKVVGEKPIQIYLQDVDALKMVKIKEFHAKAEVKYIAPAGGLPKAISNTVASQKLIKLTPAVSTGSIDDVASVASSSSASNPVKEKTKPNVSTKSGAKKIIKSGTTKVKASSAKGKIPPPKKEIATSKVEVTKGLLLPTNQLKEQRLSDEKSFKTLKWNFTSPKEEFYIQLKEQMINANWDSVLVTNCFHSDFKYHIRAIDSLNEFLTQGNVEASVANCDLIIKWISLRFFDTNPSVILRALEYLIQLFSAYRELNFQFQEHEAHSFLPYLIQKGGDPKDAVKNKVHEILVRLKDIYSPSKLFTFLMNALTSKNSRQRAMCLDEIAILIEGYGLSVCQPSAAAALKDIAKQIGDRDNSVRNAALSCAVQAYFIEGEKIYKHVGHLSDKDMSMLEERIKRAVKNRPPPKKPSAPLIVPPKISNPEPKPYIASGTITKSSPSKASPKHQNVIVNHINTYTDDERELTPERETTPSPEPVIMPSYTSGKSTITKRRPKPSGPITLDLDEIENQYERKYSFDEINNHQVSPPKINLNLSNPRITRSKTTSVEDLLNLPEVTLHRRSSPNDSTTINPPGSMFGMISMSPKIEIASNLIIAQLVTHEIPIAIEALSQLHEVLERPDKADLLAPRVDQLILMCDQQFKSAIQKHMSDDNIPKAKVVDLLKSVISVLELIFKNSSLKRLVSHDVLKDMMTHIITIIVDPRLSELNEGALILKSANMLATCVLCAAEPTNMLSALIKLVQESLSGSGNNSAKYMEILMKCIWKVFRLWDQWIDELNVNKILYDIHIFFRAFPDEYWRNEARSDVPLRTIKTITFKLAQEKGESIYNYLTLIPDRNDSELYHYLEKALKKIAKGECLSHSKRKTTPGQRITKQDHFAISNILTKIGTDHSKEAFEELVRFLDERNSFPFESYIQKHNSEYFSSFVLDNLRKYRDESRKENVLNASANGKCSYSTTNGNLSNHNTPKHRALSPEREAKSVNNKYTGDQFTSPINNTTDDLVTGLNKLRLDETTYYTPQNNNFARNNDVTMMSPSPSESTKHDNDYQISEDVSMRSVSTLSTRHDEDFEFKTPYKVTQNGQNGAHQHSTKKLISLYTPVQSKFSSNKHASDQPKQSHNAKSSDLLSSEDLTNKDVFEWLKINVAKLGADTSKYDDPEQINRFMNLSSDISSDTRDIIQVKRIADEARRDVEKFRQKYCNK